jgi:glycosyltransferase involved in cell wall biosynthesis
MSAHLDVVIATHNRATLLGDAIESVFAATPGPFTTSVIVAENNCTDHTADVLAAAKARHGARVRVVHEKVPGRSPALNAGIAAGTGDLVATIDDDETVNHDWLLVIARAFEDPRTDFIGGPYVPRWGADRPDWLGSSYRGVIGWVDSGPEIRQYGPGFNAMLMGGNAVFRRRILDRIGPYPVDIGRKPDKLLAGEDEEIFRRLLDIGAVGYYRPDLIIHHFIPPERLRKEYFRRWCFWRGVSMGVVDRRKPEDVPYSLGVPRYMIGRALRAAGDTVHRMVKGGDRERLFNNELTWWDLAGFIYGKHWYGTE